jgi:hypothetical protein
MTAFAVTAAIAAPATIAAPAIVVAVIMTPAVMMMVMMMVMAVVILAMSPFAVAITMWSRIGSALRPRARRQAEQPHAQNQLMYFI